MKTVYQIESRLKDGEWLEDHLPFNSKEEALNYIRTQPRCFEFRIVTWEEPETDSEWLEFNDATDAIGGDWEG